MVGAVGGLNIAPPNGRQHTHTFPINPFFFFFFFFLFLYRNVVGLARSIYIRDKPETLSLLAAWGRGSPRSVRGRAENIAKRDGPPHTHHRPPEKREGRPAHNSILFEEERQLESRLAPRRTCFSVFY
jgi:hypothetical protein